MPGRTALSAIRVTGAAPIVIGQVGEFDYSGALTIKPPKG